MKYNLSNPNKDLQAIREIMERSSRFLSLSGLSGICAGIFALAGAVYAWFFILDTSQASNNILTGESWILSSPDARISLTLDAIIVFILAVLGAIYYSYRKARMADQRFWTSQSRRLLIHLLIPLVSGGIFSLILILRDQWVMIPSVMLIFYGLSLVNAGKFTLGEIHYLGLTEIALGILAGFFIQQGLLFWAIGFGFMHIFYGIVMYYRYETTRSGRNKNISDSF